MTAVGDIVGTVTPDTVGVTDEVLKRRNDCDCTPITLPIPYNPSVATRVGRRRSFMSMDARIIIFLSGHEFVSVLKKVEVMFQSFFIMCFT